MANATYEVQRVVTDLLTRARRAAAVECGERAALLLELVERCEELERELLGLRIPLVDLAQSRFHGEARLRISPNPTEASGKGGGG